MASACPSAVVADSSHILLAVEQQQQQRLSCLQNVTCFNITVNENAKCAAGVWAWLVDGRTKFEVNVCRGYSLENEPNGSVV